MIDVVFRQATEETAKKRQLMGPHRDRHYISGRYSS